MAIVTAQFDEETTSRLIAAWEEVGFVVNTDYPPHITLVYDKERESFDELEGFELSAPLSGTIGGGLIVFDTPDGLAHCASTSIDGLAELYAELRGALDSFNPSYDFTPHCTIGFYDEFIPIIPDKIDVTISGLVIERSSTPMEDEDTGAEETNVDTMTTTVESMMSLVAAAEREDAKRWKAVLCVEEEQTPDGRMLQADSITWRETPLTLMMNFEAAHGGIQGGSQIVGVIENIRREGLNILGEGRFDTSPYGKEAQRLVEEGIVSGISVDLRSLKVEDRALEMDYAGNPTEVIMVVLEGIVLAATITPMQAITSAKIWIDEPGSEDDGVRMCTSESNQSEDFESIGCGCPGGEEVESYETNQPSGERGGIVAAGGHVFNSKFFEYPKFTGRTHVTVTDDSRIYGHIAVWNTCHIGASGVCLTAPNSPTDYSFYRVGKVSTDRGPVRVGLVTMNTGHAGGDLNSNEAISHYDNTSTIAAYVNVGEDAYGIWISGAVSPRLTPEDVTNLSACSLSGDWRNIDGNLELVALLAVNVPGYPVAVRNDGVQNSLIASAFFNEDNTMENETETVEEATEALSEEPTEELSVEETEALEAEDVESMSSEDTEELAIDEPVEETVDETLESSEEAEETVEEELAAEPEDTDIENVFKSFTQFVDETTERIESLSAAVESLALQLEMDRLSRAFEG